MKIGHEDLRSFEERADASILELVHCKPLRSLMTLLNVAAYTLSHNRGFGQAPDEARRGIGIERLGYLLPIAATLDAQLLGSSAVDVLSAWGSDEDGVRAFARLQAYAAFCEAAPFAHRGSYAVELSGSHLKLTHPSAEFAATEVKDILISQLFQPMTLHDSDFGRAWFDAQVRSLPTVDALGLNSHLQQLTAWFRQHTLEISPLTDEAIVAATGVTMSAFRGFSAACLAFAQVHMSMADAISRLATTDDTYGHDPVARE